MLPTFDSLALEAELLTIDFQNMFVRWGNSSPARNGLHASSLLVTEQEWCVRRHVLAELFPQEAQPVERQSWDWRTTAIFENGWDLHQRWQELFKRFGNVVFSEGRDGQPEPELDLTHYDETRNLYFSPDAIIEFGGQKYVVEIKGINHDAYEKLTDDLSGAMKACETVNKAFYQCQLYMHLLEIQCGIILVENKNNQKFKVWCIESDRHAVQPYLERIYAVKGSLARYSGKSKIVPARICKSRLEPLACKCPMRQKCFSEKG